MLRAKSLACLRSGSSIARACMARHELSKLLGARTARDRGAELSLDSAARPKRLAKVGEALSEQPSIVLWSKSTGYQNLCRLNHARSRPSFRKVKAARTRLAL